eukprot:5306139-Pyramimonas_sp.AAC.1
MGAGSTDEPPAGDPLPRPGARGVRAGPPQGGSWRRDAFFSPPGPYGQAGVTIGLLPACFPPGPHGQTGVAQVP